MSDMQEYEDWYNENNHVVVELPFIGALTWHELHASELGLIGLFRPSNPLFYILLYLIVSEGNANRTVELEPWYFIAVSITTTLIRRYVL